MPRRSRLVLDSLSGLQIVRPWHHRLARKSKTLAYPSKLTSAIPLIPTTFVAALFASQNDPNVCIIKFADGRGFRARGNYADVRTQLLAQPN